MNEPIVEDIRKYLQNEEVQDLLPVFRRVDWYVDAAGIVKCRDPRTGAAITIAARNKPKFKPGKTLTEAVNKASKKKGAS